MYGRVLWESAPALDNRDQEVAPTETDVISVDEECNFLSYNIMEFKIHLILC